MAGQHAFIVHFKAGAGTKLSSRPRRRTNCGRRRCHPHLVRHAFADEDCAQLALPAKQSLAEMSETVEVKVAPIECDLEQLMQRGDAAVPFR